MTVTVQRRVNVVGVVQGVGFRPFIWRRATRLGLAGWVANESGGVVIEVRGPTASIDAFLDRLVEDAPPLAMIRSVRIDDGSTGCDVAPAAGGFAILESARRPGRSTPPPADVATCDACLAEVADPASRRHGYAFTNCTDCGPRYTIIADMPYDRIVVAARS